MDIVFNRTWTRGNVGIETIGSGWFCIRDSPQTTQVANAKGENVQEFFNLVQEDKKNFVSNYVLSVRASVKQALRGYFENFSNGAGGFLNVDSSRSSGNANATLAATDNSFRAGARDLSAEISKALSKQLFYRNVDWKATPPADINDAQKGEIGSVGSQLGVWRNAYLNRWGKEQSTSSVVTISGGIPLSTSGVAAGTADSPWGWYLCERPWKTFRMGSAILAKGGNELGVTFYGHCNFQWSDNTTTKTHEGHFTFYSRPVVRNVKQYCIAEDIFVIGYVSGEVSGHDSDHFIKHSEIENSVWDASRTGDLYDGHLGSILAYHISGKNAGTLDEVRKSISNPHSISGQWGVGLQKSYGQSQSGNKYQFPTAAFVSQKFKQFFDSLSGEMYRVVNGPFSSVGSHNMVTWESGYYSMSNGEKYDSSAKERIYVEPSCALPGVCV